MSSRRRYTPPTHGTAVWDPGTGRPVAPSLECPQGHSLTEDNRVDLGYAFVHYRCTVCAEAGHVDPYLRLRRPPIQFTAPQG
ncbi:hypothetical protein [Actinokineospora globicatena]|uniref:Uncharacterized protein n=1 Tax=Actinokineospora globicatena TaxID=103729 RepID=A0A9W6QJW6_9PSEU|nr:hypothetical protein [Actinokineospora globicatena]GLW91793.1 hypothetical protein Aglo03_26090 [Actinokineospora globicatena]